MDDTPCAICGTPCGPALYRTTERSLTSLCEIVAAPTAVYACPHCGHAQSAAFADVGAYYESGYDILVDSEEEDQVYEVRDGVPRYRTQHQVETLLDKLGLEGAVDMLDYGCAKGSTLRVLCEHRSGIVPHLFDVSNRYQPFWQRFAKPQNCSAHALPPAWQERFDVVTSFFSLEHVPAPGDAMRKIAGLLKPGGIFYGIVPNVGTNIADLIVIDHCNHFTTPSLTWLVAEAGLELVDIDVQAHRGAFVVLARKSPRSPTPALAEVVQKTLEELHRAADFWRGAAERVRDYEAALAPGESLAIYGAGFYGAFLAASLAAPERLVCHLDQNPFLQGKSANGRPILAPAQLPADVQHVLVGLNPAHARRIVADIPALVTRGLDYFFL